MGDFGVSGIQVYLTARFYAAKRDFLQKQDSAHVHRNVKVVRVPFIITEGLHQYLVKDKDKSQLFKGIKPSGSTVWHNLGLGAGFLLWEKRTPWLPV